MSEESEIRYCKNKKCHKELPIGYKHKYCEACRNMHAQTAKNIVKGVGGTLGLVVTIATLGKINPRNKA